VRAKEGDYTLMRIFIGEDDRCGSGPHEGKPLYRALLSMLREHGCAGASVIQGIAGFGASARIHTGSLLRLSMDLPVIIEVVDADDRIRDVLPLMDDMIGGGLVTLEKVHVMLYRAQPDRGGSDTRPGKDP
jgi:PII-like signaling protein